MSAPSNPAIALTDFALDLVTFEPASSRRAIIAKLQFRTPERVFAVVCTARGHVMVPGQEIAPELRQAIEAEAHKVVAMALREAAIRGERARGILRRLQGKTTVTPRAATAAPYRPGSAA